MLRNMILQVVTALQCRKGVSSLECGVLAGAIATAAAAVVGGHTTGIDTVFTAIGHKLTAAGGGG